MACGSGRYLADLMAGAMPQISGEGLDVSRYRGSRGPAPRERHEAASGFAPSH
jgi:D-amino-acid dehydrogenase